MISPNELNQLNDVVVTTIVSLISDKLVDLSGKSSMVLYLTPRDFKKEVKDACGLAPTILELKAAEKVCKENGWGYSTMQPALARFNEIFAEFSITRQAIKAVTVNGYDVHFESFVQVIAHQDLSLKMNEVIIFGEDWYISFDEATKTWEIKEIPIPSTIPIPIKLRIEDILYQTDECSFMRIDGSRIDKGDDDYPEIV